MCGELRCAKNTSTIISNRAHCAQGKEKWPLIGLSLSFIASILVVPLCAQYRDTYNGKHSVLGYPCPFLRVDYFSSGLDSYLTINRTVGKLTVKCSTTRVAHTVSEFLSSGMRTLGQNHTAMCQSGHYALAFGMRAPIAGIARRHRSSDYEKDLLER